jgi:hypothetical protein
VPNAADFFQQVQDLIATAIPGTNACVILSGFWLPDRDKSKWVIGVLYG